MNELLYVFSMGDVLDNVSDSFHLFQPATVYMSGSQLQALSLHPINVYVLGFNWVNSEKYIFIL